MVFVDITKLLRPSFRQIFIWNKMKDREDNHPCDFREEPTLRISNTRQFRTRIVLNISGEIYETYVETLNRFPNTLLGSTQKRIKHFCPTTKQYFFERNRLCFESILFFYQSNGTLNCPVGTSISLFEEECLYFQLPTKFIHTMKRKEGIFPELIKEEETKTSCKVERKNVIVNVLFKLKLWSFLDLVFWHPVLSSYAIVHHY